jgi:hypothetical protein
MSTSSSPSDSRPSRKRRSRSPRFLRKAGKFWREWRAEIVIGLLVVLAVFLLVEQMNIRQSLYAGLVTLVEWLNRAATGVIEGLARLARTTTVSDLTAYVLLLVVAGLVVWRVRHRLLTMPRFSDLHCPQCGGELTRMHRRWSDRVLGWFVPLRRYQCRNHDCAWQGLRVYRSKRAERARPQE